LRSSIEYPTGDSRRKWRLRILIGLLVAACL
jgi:hypothetical protein